MPNTSRRACRIAWITTPEQRSNYTYKVLTWWIKKHGGECVGIEDSPDVVCVSFCSPRERVLLNKAREAADKAGAPLLLGGPESYTGAVYLAWADYLCVGEGWALFRDLCKAGGKETISILESCEYVLSRRDPFRKVTPNYEVVWNTPIVQTAKHGWYTMAGRGCHRKCKFCYTSWTQPNNNCPDSILDRAQKKVDAKGGQNKLIYITNDAGIGKSAASTTAQRFLANPHKRWPMVVRLGVEGLTEERRKWFGKPISDADLAATVHQAKNIGRQLQWFVIIGWPDDPAPADAWNKMVEILGHDASRAPRIYVKYTWFEPAPHTPLAKWDLHQLTAYDYERAHHNLVAASGRFRRFEPGSIGMAVWSACLRRLGPDRAFAWAAYQNKAKHWNAKTATAMAKAELGKAIVSGETAMAWENIQTQIRG